MHRVLFSQKHVKRGKIHPHELKSNTVGGIWYNFKIQYSSESVQFYIQHKKCTRVSKL